MIGLGILIFLFIWAALALLIANLIGKKLLKRFTKDTETGRTTGKGTLIILLLSVLVFFAPILDQLIAYPKWQQLCSTTGDFEWGPGMDEKKAFGREIVVQPEQTQASIFPNIKIEYSSMSIYDAKTRELIFKKPHYAYSASAFIYLPSSSGDKGALFLPSCATYGLNGENLEKKLQLTEAKNQGK